MLDDLPRDDPEAAVAVYRAMRRAGTWRREWGEYLTMLQSTAANRETLWAGMKAVERELGGG